MSSRRVDRQSRIFNTVEESLSPSLWPSSVRLYIYHLSAGTLIGQESPPECDDDDDDEDNGHSSLLFWKVDNFSADKACQPAKCLSHSHIVLRIIYAYTQCLGLRFTFLWPRIEYGYGTIKRTRLKNSSAKNLLSFMCASQFDKAVFAYTGGGGGLFKETARRGKSNNNVY